MSKHTQSSVYLDTENNNVILDVNGVIQIGGFLNDVDLLTQTRNDIISKSISRIAVDEISYNLPLGNVNGSVDTIQFYSSNTGGIGGTVHTTHYSDIYGLSTDYIFNYLSETDLIDDLILALNLLTGASGLTFSYSSFPIDPNYYYLNCAGGSFCMASQISDGTRISNLSLSRGKYLWNFSKSQTLNTFHVFGGVLGMPTRYIDIISTQLLDDQELPITSSSDIDINSVIYRIYLDVNHAYSKNFIGLKEIMNLRYIKKDPSRSISSLKIRFRDEHGLPMLVPRASSSTESNGYLMISLRSD